MKKIDLNSMVAQLTRDQMRVISGGASFNCYCGFVGGPGEQFQFYVEAENINDALWGAGSVCGGQGATCTGN